MLKECIGRGMSVLRFKALSSPDYEKKKERILINERQNSKIRMNEQCLADLILGKEKLLFPLAKVMPVIAFREN